VEALSDGIVTKAQILRMGWSSVQVGKIRLLEIMESKFVVKALAALAQPSRLEIFRTLVAAGETGLTPGAMGDDIGVAPNTLSFHLKELLHADLITQERTGRNLIYRAQYDRMNDVLAYLTENCCQGQARHSDDTSTCA
jgi:DNA-binding transcriptional ArsR family regulator